MPADQELPAGPGSDVSDSVPDDRAVLDRIVDGTTAVVLVGPDEVEMHVPATSLPDGAQDGTWLVLDLDGDTPQITVIDHERTAQRTADLEGRLARLRATRTRGRFQRAEPGDMTEGAPGEHDG